MKLYPIAPEDKTRQMRREGVKARRTGEKRPPKKGEWYLSGAIAEAYQAPNDLTHPEVIAELVTVTKTIETVTPWKP